MEILIIVATVLSALILYSFIKKLMKWMVIFVTTLLVTLIGGYLFLSGDGSLTQEYLPEIVQDEVNTLRNNTNQAIQQKANETKEKAIDKATEVTEKASNQMKEGIQKAVDESKKSIEKSVHDALNGTTTEEDSVTPSSSEDDATPVTN